MLINVRIGDISTPALSADIDEWMLRAVNGITEVDEYSVSDSLALWGRREEERRGEERTEEWIFGWVSGSMFV